MARKPAVPMFAVRTGQVRPAIAKRTYKIMTVKVPLDLHHQWNVHKAKFTDPENFQDFVIRKLRDELEQE